MRTAVSFLALGATLSLGTIFLSSSLEAQSSARPSPQDMRNAVIDALARECPDKAAQVESANCTTLGFDGQRMSCSYRLAKRFGSQTIRVTDQGSGWRAESGFNLCEMPPLQASFEPRRDQFVQAVRAQCAELVPEIGNTTCSRQFNPAVPDSYTCRFTQRNVPVGQPISAEIALDGDHWELLQPARLCAPVWNAQRNRPLSPRSPQATAGRYELSLAMRDICPEASERLAFARCTASQGDPTEFLCRFRVEGRPEDETVIARDNDGWTLIDIPNSCSVG